jgi:hypothetical protein
MKLIQKKYNQRKIIISFIGICVIVVSLLFFVLSINRTYVGAAFTLKDDLCIVQIFD